MTTNLPSGTVTILFADVEGSTRLAHSRPDEWLAIVDRLDDVFTAATGAHAGHLVGIDGDTVIAVFERARDAAAAAADAVRAFAGGEPGLAVALHTGEVTLRRERYYGVAMHRAAGLAHAAHPGQILVSSTTAGLLADAPPAGATTRDLGEHALRGFDRPERIHQLVVDGLPAEFPPPSTQRAEPTLPTGTVTFLFSDLEDSTRVQQRLRERYADVLATHRRLFRQAAAAAGGREVDTQGDAFFFAFARARDAVAAAAACQRAHREQQWPDGASVRVRMGMNTGEPTIGEEGYLGLDVVRAARICSAAHGGQVLMSESTRALLRDDVPDGISLRDLGEHRLKDFDEPERIFEATIDGAAEEFPALKADRITTADALATATNAADIAAHVDAVLKEQLAPLTALDRFADVDVPWERAGSTRSSSSRWPFGLVLALLAAGALLVWLVLR